jgi:hypothetical protein
VIDDAVSGKQFTQGGKRSKSASYTKKDQQGIDNNQHVFLMVPVFLMVSFFRGN